MMHVLDIYFLNGINKNTHPVEILALAALHRKQVRETLSSICSLPWIKGSDQKADQIYSTYEWQWIKLLKRRFTFKFFISNKINLSKWN